VIVIIVILSDLANSNCTLSVPLVYTEGPVMLFCGFGLNRPLLQLLLFVFRNTCGCFFALILRIFHTGLNSDCQLMVILS